MSVPPSPVAWQHDVWLVSHIVLPHGTIPGSQGAPPSGERHVGGGGPPLEEPSAPELVPPSPVTLPELVPLLLPEPPLLFPPPELLVAPPLLPLPPLEFPPPNPLLDPVPAPASLPVPELDVLQFASASGSAATTSPSATIPPCIVFIELLLRCM
jgi:hypothetical protein